MFKVPEGYKLVPIEPTEEMWSELARDIVMGRDLKSYQKSDMREHLKSCGAKVSDAVKQELEGEGHLSKGDMCVLIYKAMLSLAPEMAIKDNWNYDMSQAPKDGTAILVYATDEAYAAPNSDNWYFKICPARWDGRMWAGWPLNTHFWPKAWQPLAAIGKFNPEPPKGE